MRCRPAAADAAGKNEVGNFCDQEIKLTMLSPKSKKLMAPNLLFTVQLVQYNTNHDNYLILWTWWLRGQRNFFQLSKQRSNWFYEIFGKTTTLHFHWQKDIWSCGKFGFLLWCHLGMWCNFVKMWCHFTAGKWLQNDGGIWPRDWKTLLGATCFVSLQQHYYKSNESKRYLGSMKKQYSIRTYDFWCSTYPSG